MSYALWLHPEGLPCQVFISHAWAEAWLALLADMFDAPSR
jgi:hypothetical protein